MTVRNLSVLGYNQKRNNKQKSLIFFFVTLWFEVLCRKTQFKVNLNTEYFPNDYLAPSTTFKGQAQCSILAIL